MEGEIERRRLQKDLELLTFLSQTKTTVGVKLENSSVYRTPLMYENCLAEFGRSLTVDTAVEQVVWVYAHALEGARAVAMKYVVANCGNRLQHQI